MIILVRHGEATHHTEHLTGRLDRFGAYGCGKGSAAGRCVQISQRFCRAKP